MNPNHTAQISRRVLAVVFAASAAFGLAACATTGSTTSETTAASGKQADAVQVSDAWVKAAKDGMTAAFGTLKNDTAADVRVVSVTSAASPDLQLHETVDDGTGTMVMREVAGFTIPAHGSLELAPGGNHIMFMSVPKPITAGEDVTIELTFDDGSTHEFTAPAKDYSGANENYEGGDMDMSTPQPTGH